MDVSTITEQLGELKTEAEAALPDADTRERVEALRVQYLGKKGKITAVLRSMGKLAAEDRPKVGQLAKRVGMERTHLYRKLRSLGVDFKSVASDD